MKPLFIIFTTFSIALFISCGDGNVKNKIEASGNIEAINVVVSSQVNGKVISILKDEGSRIDARDTIMIIDPSTYEMQLRAAEASLAASDAQFKLLKNGARKEDIKQVEESLKQAEVNYQTAEQDAKRYENLFQSKSITKKQYDDAVAKLEITRAQLDAAKANYNKSKNLARPEELKQAEANVNRLKANVDIAKKSLNDCYVISPSEGIIVKKFMEIGENAGMMTSLFKVSNLSLVDLIVYVSETELGKVQLNQTVDVIVDTYPDKTYQGKIIYISPEAEFTPKSIQTKDERTKLVYRVKVRISNPNYELKDGMPADASIILSQSDNNKKD
jgi:HlyD family secretion protein